MAPALSMHSVCRLPSRYFAEAHTETVLTDTRRFCWTYFRQVHEGLRPLLQHDQAPLVMAGVDSLFPIYQQASTYPCLMKEHLRGNPDNLTAEVHEIVLGLIQQGWVTGLRIDHPDGLFDPDRYFRNLQKACQSVLPQAGRAAGANGPAPVPLAALRRPRPIACRRPECFFLVGPPNDARVIRPRALGGCQVDAQWSDDFHHSLHTSLTGTDRGCLADFGRLEHLGKAIREGFVYHGIKSKYRRRRHGNSSKAEPGYRLVVCTQNHDPIANACQGERLSQLVSLEQQKLAAAALVCNFAPAAPQVPVPAGRGEWKLLLWTGDPNSGGQDLTPAPPGRWRGGAAPVAAHTAALYKQYPVKARRASPSKRKKKPSRP